MKKPNPPKLVTVTVTTTITIIFWIFFTLYQVLTANPEPSVNEKLLEPIIPELDSATLQQLQNRVFFEEGSFTFSSQFQFPPTNEQTQPEVVIEGEVAEETTEEISPTPSIAVIEEEIVEATPTP